VLGLGLGLGLVRFSFLLGSDVEGIYIYMYIYMYHGGVAFLAFSGQVVEKSFPRKNVEVGSKLVDHLDG
jgi:hypothetical protein